MKITAAFFILIMFFSLYLYADEDSTIKIGFIDNNPVKVLSRQAMIGNYMQEQLKDYGIINNRIVVAADIEEMSRLLKNNGVDIVIDSIFTSLILRDKTKCEVVLRRWKKGAADYKTYFLVKKGSALIDLKNLNGKKIGFEDPTSASARWLPHAILKQMKYKLVPLNSPDEIVKQNEVGYVFTGDSLNSPVWLLQNKVDLIVMSNNDYDELAAPLVQQLKIIHESFPIPRQLVLLRKNLTPKLKERIIFVFTNMDRTPEGQTLLGEWENTVKVDAIDSKVKEAISEVTKLLKFIEDVQ